MIIKETIKRIISIFSKTNNSYCPCCDQQFIEFLPYGLQQRPNAQCPNCYSLERHRLHWLFLTDRINSNPEQANLLHVAPEQIFYNFFNQDKKISYFPIAKLEPGYPDEYPKNTVNMDLTALEYKDNFFDIIYCSHVLEHITEDIRAMKEMLRVLNPTGYALLQVPLDKTLKKTYEDFSITSPKEREQHFGQPDHVRVYGLDYIDRLEKSGFNVQIIDYRSMFSSEAQNRFGLNLPEDLYLCTKKA